MTKEIEILGWSINNQNPIAIKESIVAIVSEIVISLLLFLKLRNRIDLPTL
jgi:hypothetical protein